MQKKRSLRVRMNPEKTESVYEDDAKKEVDAFFSLPRQRLYMFGLLLALLLGAMFCVALLLARVDGLVFVLPAVAGVGAAVTSILNQSPAGRGCLRTVGLGWSTGGARIEPETQRLIWVVASMVTLGIALWVQFT